MLSMSAQGPKPTPSTTLCFPRPYTLNPVDLHQFPQLPNSKIREKQYLEDWALLANLEVAISSSLA